jgi:hypothetical protein
MNNKYRTDSRTAEQKKLDERHDRQVRAKALALKPVAEGMGNAQLAMKDAGVKAKQAVEQFHSEHPERKRTSDESQKATASYRAAVAAAGELANMERANPRAFGLPWLTAAESQQNANLLSQIASHESSIVKARSKLFPFIAP